MLNKRGRKTILFYYILYNVQRCKRNDILVSEELIATEHTAFNLVTISAPKYAGLLSSKEYPQQSR